MSPRFFATLRFALNDKNSSIQILRIAQDDTARDNLDDTKGDSPFISTPIPPRRQSYHIR